uniref:Uncharacterized protein n=1 Tax=Hyaloperonospora arabidopsidis (strain Emoy2) TaxID=559515 RepID=M4BMQ0_HYAAE
MRMRLSRSVTHFFYCLTSRRQTTLDQDIMYAFLGRHEYSVDVMDMISLLHTGTTACFLSSGERSRQAVSRSSGRHPIQATVYSATYMAPDYNICTSPALHQAIHPVWILRNLERRCKMWVTDLVTFLPRSEGGDYLLTGNAYGASDPAWVTVGLTSRLYASFEEK